MGAQVDADNKLAGQCPSPQGSVPDASASSSSALMPAETQNLSECTLPAAPTPPKPPHEISVDLNAAGTLVSSPAIDLTLHGSAIGLGLNELYANFKPGQTFDLNSDLIIHGKPLADYLRVFDNPSFGGVVGLIVDANEVAHATCKVAEVCDFNNPFKYRLDEPIKVSVDARLGFIDKTGNARLIQDLTYDRYDVSANGSLAIDGSNVSNLEHPLLFLINPKSKTAVAVDLGGSAVVREQRGGTGLYLADGENGQVGFGYEVGTEKRHQDSINIHTAMSVNVARQQGAVGIVPDLDLTMNQHSVSTNIDTARAIGHFAFEPHVGIDLFDNHYSLKVDALLQGGLQVQSSETEASTKVQQITAHPGVVDPVSLLTDINHAIPLEQLKPVDTKSESSDTSVGNSLLGYLGVPLTTKKEGWGLEPFIAFRDAPDSRKVIGGANFYCDKLIDFSGTVSGSYEDDHTSFVRPQTNTGLQLVYTPWSAEPKMAYRYAEYLDDQNKQSMYLISSETLAKDLKVQFYRDNPHLSVGFNTTSDGSYGGFVGYSQGQPFWIEANALTQHGSYQLGLDVSSGPLTVSALYHAEKDPRVKDLATQTYALDVRYDFDPGKWGVLLDLSNDPVTTSGIRATGNVVLSDW